MPNRLLHAIDRKLWYEELWINGKYVVGYHNLTCQLLLEWLMWPSSKNDLF